jgi:hypothetical protein
MTALLCEAAEITTGSRSLLEFTCFERTNAWMSDSDRNLPLGELLCHYTGSAYKLVDAQYLDCDPSISGAFRTKFFSIEHFGSRDVCPDAEWVCPALRDYADFPWEAVWWTTEPLFRNDDAGPRVLRIHLMHQRLDIPVDLFAHLH